MTLRGIDSFGAINWWGFSPHLDLQETGLSQLLNKLDIKSNPDKVQLLVVGSGDLRHVLTTMAHRYRHPQRKLHFYIIESALELYARHILFLTIALEAQKRMGLQEKTELYLELFGNTLVRKQTADYVEKMATEFIKFVTDLEYLEKRLPCLDLSQLKFKERDFLEGIFKFWRNSKPEMFDVRKCWDLRLRQHLGTRYDSRFNIFDWDYSMTLTERGGSIVNTLQYKNWRNTGVAFQIREGSYDVPNKTLASSLLLKHEGERHVRRGYWGDIIVSPYIPLGIESEEKSFFKKQNMIHMKTAEDVAEFNTLSMFHELAMGRPYSLPAKDHKSPSSKENQGPKLQEITEEDEEKESEGQASEGEHNEANDKSVPKDDPQESVAAQRPLDQEYESLPIDNVTVTFLPIGCVPDLPKRTKFQKAFDVVYFSNSMVHHLTPNFNAVFADHCTVLIESALFMLELKKEHVAKFVENTISMAKAAGCRELDKCNSEQDHLVKMYFQR